MAQQAVNRNLLLHLLAENELTQREIGKRLSCSAERVKQLEQKVLGTTGNEARREKREKKLRAVFDGDGFVKAAERRAA